MKTSTLKEPTNVSWDHPDYSSKLATAFNYYHQEKEKKDARLFLKSYAKTLGISKSLDGVPDHEISNTFGWVARLIENGNNLDPSHIERLNDYITKLKPVEVEKPAEKQNKPTIQENIQEKVAYVLGELEGLLDDSIFYDKEVSLYNHLKSNNIPKIYSNSIQEWITKKAAEIIEVYESSDGDLKEGYSNLGKRKLTSIIKLLSTFSTDLERYTEYKKANKKPRAKKTKPATQQVSKLKYKKEDETLRVKSVVPTEIIGASQVWVYNCKYKRLSAYRTDSALGIQVKGTSLQNYDPDMCEMRSVRRPEVVLENVLKASKVQLRKLLSDLGTTEFEVTGRINEECLIVRVVK